MKYKEYYKKIFQDFVFISVYTIKYFFIIVFIACYFLIDKLDSIRIDLGYINYEEEYSEPIITYEEENTEILNTHTTEIKNQVISILQKVSDTNNYKDEFYVNLSDESFKELEVDSTYDLDSFNIYISIINNWHGDNTKQQITYEYMKNYIVNYVKQINNLGYSFDIYGFKFMIEQYVYEENKYIEFEIRYLTEDMILNDNLYDYIRENISCSDPQYYNDLS